MDNTVLGILAHVDAGKTTLSEALLYTAGQLRALGRVDHKNSFLDTDALERERGITIFSKQAIFPLGQRQITLLDTPGHVDFSAEMERALQVMDCALLVVSGTDGVQSHTRTLWRLLARYRIPTLLFCNKMDLPNRGEENLMGELHTVLDERCVDFSAPRGESFWESVALCDEDLLADYLDKGSLSSDILPTLLAQRKLFPCWFGSALKLEGVAEFLSSLETLLPRKGYPNAFSAQVYKVEHPQGSGQVTHLKITGGSLKVKSTLSNQRPGLDESQVWTEKVDQIRLYSGEKFQTIDVAPAGTLCAVTGLTKAVPGQVFGDAPALAAPALQAVRTYQALLPEGQDPYTAYGYFQQLAAEDPQLHVSWDAHNRAIHIQLMGEIQGEVLRRVLADRFGLSCDFGPGQILYKETLAAPAIGIGHFEPLRHYAEVHLLLEPAEPGSGLHFFSNCPQEMMDFTWQRLALNSLASVSHPGVLTGSPVTDLNITLVAGRAHPKHTEGGDFRQAACRALRQGLMSGQSVLLEPWYDIRLELPQSYVGRAMADLGQMGAETDPPETLGEDVLLTASVSVAAFGDYPAQVAGYTHGLGRLICQMGGYRPCRDQEAVVASIGYDPERDTENPADSVFCSHGAGHTVPWREVSAHAHVSSGLKLTDGVVENAQVVARAPQSTVYTGTAAQDAELQAIFERTYGPIKSPGPRPMTTPKAAPTLPDKVQVDLGEGKAEYLLVDGYNIIFAWDELKTVAQQNLDAARVLLTELLSNYQGYRGNRVILVFDAYKVKGGMEKVERHNNITVVYTKEAETADAYIEKATYRLGKGNRVRVATSDGLVQVIILGHGALRLSASALHQEMETALGQIDALVRKSQLPSPAQPIAQAFEKAQKKAEQEGRP